MDVARLIDHTLLKPEATERQIHALCAEALQFRFATVCINPCWVPVVRRLLGNDSVKTCSVVGFPLATVLGLKPEEWPEKIESWSVLFKEVSMDTYSNKWKLLLTLILGLVFGYAAKKRRPPNVLTAAEFSRKYQDLFDNNDIRSLLIFGYTYETVRDYQKYDHFYQQGLEIRVLNRSWIAEKADEDAHNRKIEGLNLRRWRKSETIHQSALSPWTYKAKREVRYYDFSHPIIKGAILKSKNATWAFVNFYIWEEVPPEGGSQFKGADLGMIFLDGSNQEEHIKIRALESQFELIWKFRSSPIEHVKGGYSSYIPE